MPASREGTDAGRNIGREGWISCKKMRDRRYILAGTTICASLLLVATTIAKVPILLLWNASPSVRIGLYRVESKTALHKGDMVVAWAPDQARRLAAERNYFPAPIPIVKVIAAAARDRVCAKRAAISINGRQMALRLASDPAGRTLPWWTGCHTLGRHEYFLLAPAARSFDGRYFGISDDKAIVGRAVLLWPR